MKVLIIGGNRFMGYHLAWRMALAGDQVTVLNRGSVPDPFLGRVEQIVADRKTTSLAEHLRHRQFDAVVDFAAFDASDVKRVTDALPAGTVGHYIFISSGQVYLVRRDCPTPSVETDYDGPVMDAPPSPFDTDDWLYGIHKRQAEDHLEALWSTVGYPVTRVRIPIVLGHRDPAQRVQQYLLRLLDGGPVWVSGHGDKQIRPVYGPEVARFLHAIVGRPDTFGQAYNFAQHEIVTVRDTIAWLADALGTSSQMQSFDAAWLREHKWTAKQVSPFDGRWTSLLDPSRAESTFTFQHRAMRAYLEEIARSFVDGGPTGTEAYLSQRTVERAMLNE